MTDDHQPALQLAHCLDCSSYTYPADTHACRRCGAPRERLQARPSPGVPHLRNVVTLYTQLHPDLPAPCVLGEVELAPGVVEEAVLEVPDESAAVLGMALQAVAQPQKDGTVRWRFAPLAAVAQGPQP